MVKYNIFYEINGGAERIKFVQHEDNLIIGTYIAGKLQGKIIEDKFFGNFHNVKNNSEGIIEIIFFNDGFEARWKTGLDSGPLKGKWIGTLNLDQEEENEFLKFGNNLWTTKNLTSRFFQNGEDIPQAKNSDDWVLAVNNKEPIWAYPEFEEKNAKFGLLYNWYALNDNRKIVPHGFEIPSLKAWKELVESLGGDEVAGGEMKSVDGWIEEWGNGSNSSKFNGYPGGYTDLEGMPSGLGWTVSWWSGDKVIIDGNEYAWTIGLDQDTANTYFQEFEVGCGYFIRCIKIA
jgi:uncharacterized protein (TIGR02145 family)